MSGIVGRLVSLNFLHVCLKFDRAQNRSVSIADMRVTRSLSRQTMYNSMFVVVIILFGLLPVQVARPSQLLGVTEEFPPYNYSSNGEVKGLMAAVVDALVEEVGVSADVKVYPWARSYKIALETPNAFIFSIGRSEQRENLFKWVGPVLDARHYLFSLKSRSDITLSSIKDASGYRIGTIRNSIREQYLLTESAQHELDIVSGSSVEANFEQLRRGKIDLWAANSLVAAYTQMKLLGSGQDVLVPALRMSAINTPYYIGFNKQFDDALYARFAEALEKFRTDGTLDFIINRETVGLNAPDK